MLTTATERASMLALIAIYAIWQLGKVCCAVTCIVLGQPNPPWLNRLLRR